MKLKAKSLKELLAKPFAKQIQKRVKKWSDRPFETQKKVFQELIASATTTAFGEDHDFVSINTYKDFVKIQSNQY